MLGYAVSNCVSVTYLRPFSDWLNANLMANQLGRKWNVELPGKEKGTLGRRTFCLGDIEGEMDMITGLEDITSHVHGWD